MGPRSHERGNPASSTGIQALEPNCFNGAASHERGNDSRRAQQAISRWVASMGPRSHERGNTAPIPAPGPAQRGFNGAAFS